MKTNNTEHYKNLSLKDIEGEVWKDIDDFIGFYQVSNMGRVKSLERKAWTGNNGGYYITIYPRILKQSLKNRRNGFQIRVVLQNTEQGCRNLTVSKLVMQHFSNEKQPKMMVLHKNHIPYDNRIENLYFGDIDDCSNEIHFGMRNNSYGLNKYRGVLEIHHWVATITVNKKIIKSIHKTEIEAAREHDRLVKKHKLNRGLNFPDD